MSCNCNKPKPAPEAPKDYTPVSSMRLSINCYCGLMRLIPTGLAVGDTFELAPCPTCGVGFKGKFVGHGVEAE